MKMKQKGKLRRLISEKMKTQPSKGKPDAETMINHSSRPLTKPEHEVLSLGLNFALPQQKLPVSEILAGTEQVARHMDHQSAQQLRENVKTSLERYKPSTRSTLTPCQSRAISSLKKDDSIVILPADNGNSTVVMDRSEYSKNIHDLQEDGTYRPLKKDPTMKLERTINERLKTLEKKGEVDDRLHKRIMPQYSYHPQLYGLPKIHKPEDPLRPIVSSIGSATYNLLTRVLTPLKGECSSYIRNSAHFVEKIAALNVHDTDITVSFDVKSFFTRVPVQEALQVIETRLHEDETLDE